MTTIRPHKKSRDGCLGCKRRKIKCDEKHPSCTSCSSRRTPCVYSIRTTKAPKSPTGASPTTNSPSRQLSLPSPIDTQLTPNMGLRMEELKLMNNYSVVLCHTLTPPSLDLSGTAKVWQREIPRLAFEHEFLMHTVLCISSYHLLDSADDNADTTALSRQSDFYLDTALQGYRSAIVNLDPNNIEAVLAASVIMVVLATRHNAMRVDGDLWVVGFLGLHAGTRSIESLFGKENMLQSSLYPLFSVGDKSARGPSCIPPNLEEMLSPLNSNNLTAEQTQVLHETLQCLGELYAFLELADSREAQGKFFLKIMASGKELPVPFVSMVREQVPQALVLLAHYLSFLLVHYSAFLKQSTRQKALVENIHRDMNSIINTLDPYWMRYMQTPLRTSSAQDPKEVIMQLMLQLSSSSASWTSASWMGGWIEEIMDSGETHEKRSMGFPDFDMPMSTGCSSACLPDLMQTELSDHSPEDMFEQSPRSSIASIF